MSKLKIVFSGINTKSTISFFREYLSVDNDAVYSSEFYCPLGVGSAIKRNQIVACVVNHEIVAAARFYPRKRDGIVSLYQFAIDPKYRKKNLLKAMLQATTHIKFEALCPIKSKFNKYYLSMEWDLGYSDEEYNHWFYEKCSPI